jgi:hypothetical protein
MVIAPTPTNFFYKANIIWALCEHNKYGLSTINLISPPQTQHGMISVQIQHIHNNTTIIYDQLNHASKIPSPCQTPCRLELMGQNLV